MLPEGWRVGKVSDICTTQYGYTASATLSDTGVRFLRVTDMNKSAWIEWSNVPFCEIKRSTFERYQLKIGDILVSRLADTGKAAIVEEEISAVFASYLVRLATSSARAYHLFYFLRSDDYKAYAEGATSGTVQDNMNARMIAAASLTIPPEDVCFAFSQTVSPLRQKIVHNLKENHYLAALRDALLPKLLSGEIRVRAAEELVAALI